MDRLINRFATLILAAGSSNRLGQPKQLLQFKGKTLIENTIQAALTNSDNCSIVLGANQTLIQKQIPIKPIDIFYHQNWKEGIGSSIAYGMKRLLEKQEDIESVLILLCDQPFISPDLLSELKSIHFKNTQTITACKYGDTFGVPAIFNKIHFSELLSLNDDKGAKKIISKHLDRTTFIDFPKGGIDIDTKEDLKYLE